MVNSERSIRSKIGQAVTAEHLEHFPCHFSNLLRQLYACGMFNLKRTQVAAVMILLMSGAPCSVQMIARAGWNIHDDDAPDLKPLLHAVSQPNFGSLL